MLGIIITILLVGAFFILFFKPSYTIKDEEEEEEEEEEEVQKEESSNVGYIEDTGLDSYGAVFEKGDMGTFVAHSTVADDSWLNGSPVIDEVI
jgi:hypothetical protein